ncbi:hypothetical protein BD770DRAFT_397381 [Pilaira anomala]|nr:hypothetical protein BD770DRAFT_397381 [Pilaira anomala]
MRSAIAFSAVLAFVASAVSAAPATAAATNCNPSYNVAPSTTCFTGCNVQAGQKYVTGWTMDSTSPLFIQSLAVMCEKTSPNYRAFMTTAGTCMAACTGDDPELFNAEFQGACAWYAQHKTDTC